MKITDSIHDIGPIRPKTEVSIVEHESQNDKVVFTVEATQTSLQSHPERQSELSESEKRVLGHRQRSL